MEKEDTSELTGGTEVGPVDLGSAVFGVEDEGFKRRVERSQKAEVRRLLRVSVARMDARRFVPPPLLAQHLFLDFLNFSFENV